MATNPEESAPVELRETTKELVYKIAEKEGLVDPEIHVTEASTKGDNYVGKLYRVEFKDKQGKKLSLIAKGCPETPALRQFFPVGLIFTREINAYSIVLPELYALQEKHNIPMENRFSFAKYYDGIKKEEFEALVMEDLQISGYKMYNRKEPFDKKHLLLIMRTLAALHSTSFAMKASNPERFEELTNLVSKKSDFEMEGMEKMMDIPRTRCLNVIEDPEVKNRVDEYTKDIGEKFTHFLKSERCDPYNVICHGDCWINNFMFKYEEGELKNMCFVDWQIIRYLSPITDIAYMIFPCTDEKIRDSLYTRSLDIYYDTLKLNTKMMGCNLDDFYPRTVFEDQIKSTMPFGLVSAMMLCPIILCNKEDVIEFSSPDDFDEKLYDNLMTKNCANRLNGVANDMVKFEII